mmetsp:Transcript_17732/g.28844  ORF Transcript_17732/g.28844 Transcript_17732/m.28844 type:complete len:509 (+) Transcript_17732:24-1550(+)
MSKHWPEESKSSWERTFDQLTVLDHVRIRALQVAFHYLLPYTLICPLWQTFIGTFPWKLALGVEAAFFIWMSRVVLRRLHETPAVLEPCHKPVKAMWRFSMDAVELAVKLGYPLEKFFSGWLLGADVQRTSRSQFRSWMSKLLHAKQLSALEPAQQADIAESVDEMCSRFDLNPPSDDDPTVRGIDLFCDPILIFQRSFLMYAIASFLPRFIVSTLFKSVLGLRRVQCRETGLYYWYRARAEYVGSTEEPPDLFLFHGLCGLTGYVPLIVATLLMSPGRGAAIFEFEDVSQCLNFSRPMTRISLIRTVRSAEYRIQRERRGQTRSCILVGHSLGSCSVAQLLEEELESKIAGIVMIDPVSLLLMLPDVAHGFLYRAPRTIFDWFCFMWCATEPGIAQYFRRSFFWYNCCFDPQTAADVPMLVCLSEYDRLVPSRVVRAYVNHTLPKADVLMWEKFDHTCFMASLRCHVQILQWIRKYSVGKGDLSTKQCALAAVDVCAAPETEQCLGG